MKRNLLLLLAISLMLSTFRISLYNAASSSFVDGTEKTIVYTEDFEGYSDNASMKASLVEKWNALDPTSSTVHKVTEDPLDASNKVLLMDGFSALMWKESLLDYEFSADMKLKSANDKSTHATGTALFIRVNSENMADKPVYEAYPAEGRPLGTSGIVLYLWQTSINILVRTCDSETGTVGDVVNFGNVRLPGGKDARSDYINVKVIDDGQGIIKLYLDDVLIVTFNLSDEKEISDGTKTEKFYTKLIADFAPDINFWDNKGVTEVDNAFVASSKPSLAYASRSLGDYVGYYVDNITMKTGIKNTLYNNAYTYLDLKDQNVFNDFVKINLSGAGSGAYTANGLYVSNIENIASNQNNFLEFVFPKTITSTTDKDYYIAIKYKYDENDTYSFFGNNSSTLTDSLENGSYDANVSRYLGALSARVNQESVIRLAGGWNICFIRISMNRDGITIATDSGYALVKKVRFVVGTDKAFTIESIGVFEDKYEYAGTSTPTISTMELARMEFEIPTMNNLPIPSGNADYRGSEIRTVLVPYFKDGGIVEGQYRQGLRFVFDDVPDLESLISYNGKEYTVKKQSALVILKEKLNGKGDLIKGNTEISPVILEELLDYSEESKAVYIYNIPIDDIDTIIVTRVYLECLDEDNHLVYIYGQIKEDSLRTVYERMDNEAKADLDPDALGWF